MVVPSHPRPQRDLMAPFTAQGHFQNLDVEHFEISELPDAAWTEYERDGDKEALATRYTLFFRSVFMPSLASALDGVRSGDAAAVGLFADRFEAGLKQRVTRQPSPMHSWVHTIVLAKSERVTLGLPFDLNCHPVAGNGGV